MPIVTVFGISEDTDPTILGNLIFAIQNKIAGVKELHLLSNQVTVFFPRDNYQPGLEEEVCVFVAIYAKPERTDEVIHKMAENIQRTIKRDFFPESLVEVLPQVLNPKHCSSSAG